MSDTLRTRSRLAEKIGGYKMARGEKSENLKSEAKPENLRAETKAENLSTGGKLKFRVEFKAKGGKVQVFEKGTSIPAEVMAWVKETDRNIADWIE